MATSDQRNEAMDAAEGTTLDPAIVASAASVVGAWYFYFAKGDHTRGLFMGLWPPTILAFASYFKQTKMNDQLERATGSGGGVVDSIERVVQGR